MANTTTTATDRIGRALRIIGAGLALRFNYTDSHHWLVESSEGTTNYKVTETTCACSDFKKHEGAIICKHMWAGPGANAAMLIMKLRRCYSLADLREVGHLYAPALDGVAAGFVETARAEYRACVTRILNRITYAPSLIEQPARDRGLVA